MWLPVARKMARLARFLCELVLVRSQVRRCRSMPAPQRALLAVMLQCTPALARLVVQSPSRVDLQMVQPGLVAQSPFRPVVR